MKSPFKGKLVANFWSIVSNKTAPGGKVAMYELAIAGESILSVAVPPDRHDFARFLAHAANFHDELVDAIGFARRMYEMSSSEAIKRLKKEQAGWPKPSADLSEIIEQLEHNQRAALAHIDDVLKRAMA